VRKVVSVKLFEFIIIIPVFIPELLVFEIPAFVLVDSLYVSLQLAPTAQCRHDLHTVVVSYLIFINQLSFTTSGGVNMAVLLTTCTEQEELTVIQVSWAEGVTDVNIHFEDTY
jgi:hypothetical protein